MNENNNEIEINNLIYNLNGVIVSKRIIPNNPNNYDYFVYSDKSPDIEAIIPLHKQKYPLKHGDWINFEVSFKIIKKAHKFRHNL